MDEARYAALAQARARLLTAASQRIPLVSIAQQARALSLWDGRQVVPGDEAQLAMVFDLGTLDPLGDHTRGIDRQAQAEPPAAGSPEATMLAALRTTRFRLLQLHGADPRGGVHAVPLAGGPAIRIADRHLARNPPGTLLGARLCWPDPDASESVAMGCGVVVPLDELLLERLLTEAPPGRGPVVPRPFRPDADAVARLLADAASVRALAAFEGRAGAAARTYRAAIDLGLMGPVPGRTPA